MDKWEGLMRKLIKPVVIVSIIGILAILLWRGPALYARYDRNRLMQDMVNERYIIHAGGKLFDDEGNEYTYTNSKDALLNCWTNEDHFIELDFVQTSDGYWVCAHNGANYETWGMGYDFDKTPSLMEFYGTKFDGKFEVLSLDILADFLRKCRDYYIITDVKYDNIEACEYISRYFSDIKDNFIIQIYHEDEYEPISNLGFKYIIYTLYRTTEEEREPENVADFASKNSLVGITFWNYYVDDEHFMSVLTNTKVPLYVHTVNEREEMEKCIKNGISGIYTDVTDKKELYYE